MKNTFFICFVVLFGCGKSHDSKPTPASPEPQTQTEAPSADAGKVSLWIRPGGYDSAVFLPVDYTLGGTKKYPFVLSLHGYNGSVLNSDHTAVGGEKSGFIGQVWDTALAATYPAIIVAPHVYPAGTSENTLWDHDKLRELILDALQKYHIDPTRVVATGYSAGALGSQDLAVKSKDLMAGIMPGAFPSILEANPCEVEDLPVWAFGNSSDPLFQPAQWTELKGKVEACPQYTQKFVLTINENVCGHGCWDEHYARGDVQAWLINQQKVIPAFTYEELPNHKDESHLYLNAEVE